MLSYVSERACDACCAPASSCATAQEGIINHHNGRDGLAATLSERKIVSAGADTLRTWCLQAVQLASCTASSVKFVTVEWLLSVPF